ncbi:MAG: S8 family serine peptidase, partial [Bdellovibrionaceae bacterium]|nr:S8 family serine peptidase [Pseudobdellovibrionaceae bacterium]
STITEQIAIESAIKAGITIVAATGNDGVGSVSYPAALPNCIAVGALDVNNKRAEFSQYGPELAIMAPGVEVDSSVPLGKGRSPVVQVKIGESSIESVKSTVLQGSRMISRPETYEMVYAGLGSEEEFKNVDVAGKIALVERGELKFSEKVKNAIQAQAKGVIIYNNADGLLNGSLSDDGSEVPVGVFMIEKVVGEKIKQSLIQGVQATAAYQVQVTNYGSNNGTSMATPHVSGVVALMKSVNKNLTPQQVKEILQRTASVIPNTNTNEYGAGLVNAEQAVIEAKNYLNP